MKLVLPYWVSKSIKENIIYLFNWESNNSVDIFDQQHPAYQLFYQNSLEIESQNLSQEHNEDIEWLKQERFLIQENDVQGKFHNTASRFHSEILHLILLPAGEACNLDCIYCYEDHADKKRMKQSHIDSLVKFIKRQNKKHVHIEYFGGEPMLNMPFIQDFGQVLKEKQIDFTAAITTNATLLNEKSLEKLYKANVKSFQITLDGPKELHNQLRISKSSSLDSFDSVCNAIKTIAQSNYEDLRVVIRLNVNRSSIEEKNFNRFVNVLENLIPKDDMRFSILTKIISDYSSLNLRRNEQAQDSYCKTIDSANEVFDKFENYISENYCSTHSKLLTNSGGFSCYAGNPNSLVITPDLLVRKCTVALNDPINIVANISEHGELLHKENWQLWEKDYSDIYCNSCFAQKTCQGNSCPLENIKQNRKICLPIKNHQTDLAYKMIQFFER